MDISLAFIGGALVNAVSNIIQYSPAIVVALLIYDKISKRK